MRKLSSICCLMAALVPAAVSLAADPFAGKFSDGKLTVQWTGSADSYSGTITLGQQQFPSTARADGQSISGTFTAGANSFPFHGTLSGDTLNLVTGASSYALQRENAPVNPLAGGAPAEPANPVASATAITNTGQLPAGYSTVATTDSGRSLAAHKPASTSLTAALQDALADMSHYFDAKPTVVRAYQDSQDPSSGGASFKAAFKGEAVNGLISCKLGQQGAIVAVLYCKASATPSDWAKLTAPANGASAGSETVMHAYQFPDGTGSIQLAQGWTTNARTCHGMFIIYGPADQVITMQLNATVVTPTSNAVRMNEQLNANAARLGGRQMPLGLYVANFDDPVNVLGALTQQFNATIRQRGGATYTLDHLKEIKENTPMMPSGRAAFANYGIATTAVDGRPVHRLELALVEVDPVSNDSFMFALSSAGAPDATYKTDLPTMLAIMNSLKENAAVFAQQTHEQIAAMNQRFAAQQQSQKEIQGAYDDYNKDMAHNELITERSNTDFDEIIRGYRTVEDTSTGDKTSVDLGNVDQVVDNLNVAQPGRYKEIPLRDEVYPLPGGGQ